MTAIVVFGCGKKRDEAAVHDARLPRVRLHLDSKGGVRGTPCMPELAITPRNKAGLSIEEITAFLSVEPRAHRIIRDTTPDLSVGGHDRVSGLVVRLDADRDAPWAHVEWIVGAAILVVPYVRLELGASGKRTVGSGETSIAGVLDPRPSPEGDAATTHYAMTLRLVVRRQDLEEGAPTSRAESRRATERTWNVLADATEMPGALAEFIGRLGPANRSARDPAQWRAVMLEVDSVVSWGLVADVLRLLQHLGAVEVHFAVRTMPTREAITQGPLAARESLSKALMDWRCPDIVLRLGTGDVGFLGG